MPLVVPTGGDLTQQWMQKLAGKKIGDKTDETTFAKSELPQEHRILKGDSMMTMDHKPDRLNIHTSDDGTVTKVTHG